MSTSRDMIHPPALQAGKAATKALIRAAGGQEAAESFTGKSQPRLSSYGGPNTDAFMPIDAVRALEAVTHGQPGHPHVTRWLAVEAGYALVMLPSAPAGDSDWHRAMGAVSKEAGDIIQRLCAALADGETPGAVTASEVRRLRIREEIADAQQCLAELDALALRTLDHDGQG